MLRVTVPRPKFFTPTTIRAKKEQQQALLSELSINFESYYAMPESSPHSPHIVVAGGTGFIGRHFAAKAWEAGYRCTLVARHRPADLPAHCDFSAWDGRTAQGDWVERLNGAAAVVNVAGRTVDCIKTPDHCDEILRSRVESVEAIGKALTQVEVPPPVWVQMSTAHIYGDPPALWCDEDSALGYGLAPTVGKAWEAAFRQNKLPQQRGVLLRTSFVIGRSGGAFPTLKRLAKWGLGGRVGHGRQGLSWVHEDDMAALLLRACTLPRMEGTYIVSAPEPVSQQAFMKELRKQLHIPVALPSPAWLTRLGARVIFRTDPELLLYGRYVTSRRLAEEGYQWQYPNLEGALEDLVEVRC